MAVEGIGIILNKLRGVKPLSNGEFQACCPAHEDRKQSLNLKEEGDKILVTCHAGCQTEAVVQALHLSMSDLFIKRGGTSTSTKEPPPQIVKTYSYQDEDSKELYQVVRMVPKSFRQRHMNGGGEWTWNMDNIRRVLYHLPEILTTNATIYLVEGEKDVDNLRDVGFIATTSPAGANNWRPEYAQYLQDKKVVIIPDKDRAGYTYAAKAIESLKDKASSLGVILLPGEDVKDVSDWLEAGGDPQALTTMEQPIDCLASLVEAKNEQPTINANKKFALTDLGNAERLVAQFGESLRYCYERKLWLTWDKNHWQWDTGNQIVNYAIKTVRTIYNEAADAPDKETREAICQHARRSENNSRIEAMITLAKALPGIPVKASELDARPWLFNVKNGTINLQTGVLQPHDKTDLQTILIPINYDPGALCPLWDNFLNKITGGNKQVVEYLQRAVGYSLTEDTKLQIFFFLYGTGNNGKSTFIMTIRKIMGEYGSKLSIDDLMTRAKKVAGAAAEGLADLQGKRFVFASEISQGHRLSVGLVKDLTGSETVKVRRLYEHEVEYLPAYKIWISGNHKPVVTDTTLSIWRRLKLIPFTVTIPPHEIDLNLPIKLESELSGILAWAVRGCLTWQTDGLIEADEVKKATATYRKDEDTLGDFLEDFVIGEPETFITKAEMKAFYLEWAKDNGIEPLGQKNFKTRLQEKGVTDGFTTDKKSRAWLLIRRRTDKDPLKTDDDYPPKPNDNAGQNDGQNLEASGQNGQVLLESVLVDGFSKKSYGKPVNSVQQAQKFCPDDPKMAEKNTKNGAQNDIMESKNMFEVKAPKRLLFIDSCPDCGSENIGAWPDGTPGYYCMDCFPTFNQEVEEVITFTPTAEWQDIPDGAVCPAGNFDFRMPLDGRRKQCRIHPQGGK